jgi:hypothetical protein
MVLSSLPIITVTDVLGLASNVYYMVCFLVSFVASFSDSFVSYSSLPDSPSIPATVNFPLKGLPVPDVFSIDRVVVSLFSHSYD